MTRHPADDIDGTADDDPAVAEHLAPLAEASTPELWDGIVARAGSAGTDEIAVGPTLRRARRGWLAPLGVAAAAAAITLGGVALLRPDDGQRVETPAVSDDGIGTPSTAPAPAPDSETAASPDGTGFPDEVEIGPDLGRATPPAGAFTVTYDGGTVVVDADGQVLGHYPGDRPAAVPSRDDLTTPAIGGVPDGCELDAILADASLRVICERDSGPTVEIAEADGTTHPIASFPPPPARHGPDARVSGSLTMTFPSPTVERGGPLLVQMSAECETRLAMIVEDAVWSTDAPDGGEIRHLDGTGYWDDTWPDGESIALGWNGDGTEASVWRFNSACSTALATPGVYAYRLDGTSRLLFPTGDEVRDVYQIPGTDRAAGLTVGSNLEGYTHVEEGGDG